MITSFISTNGGSWRVGEIEEATKILWAMIALIVQFEVGL
jgi:hypothetical protein